MKLGRDNCRAMRLLLALLAAGPAQAQAPEKKDIKLGVGGAPALYYLPLALTEKLGYFKEQGLNVEVNDFKGGSQSLTALVGGSADVVTGAYEHTLRMQAKGQDILAVIELGRYPGIALAVKKDRADKIKTIADLKGAKIGVTAPGSSTNMIVWYLMAKAGLKPDDASFIGVGAGARRHRRHPEAARSTPSPTSIPSSSKLQVDRRGRGPGRDAHHRGHHQGVGRADVGGRALPQARLHGEEPQHRAGAGQRLLQDAASGWTRRRRSRSPTTSRRNTGWATRRSTSPP